MPAKHKNQNATFRLQTRMSPAEIAQVAEVSATKIKSSIPGQPFVRFEGGDHECLRFSIRSLGGRLEVMTFHAKMAVDDAGISTVTTKIDSFSTSQATMLGFIPFGPKSLNGYPQYKKFTTTLLTDIQKSDPGASGSLTERPSR